MTDQPRDLAAELDGIDLAEEHRRIRRDHEHWYHANCMYEAPQFEWQTHEVSIHRLLEHIAALTREIEELRRPLAELKKEAESEEGMEPQRMMQYLCRRVDALQRTTRKLQPENQLMREALQWALENGVAQSYESETGFGSHGGEICIEPPAHLAPILAEAMRMKLAGAMGGNKGYRHDVDKALSAISASQQHTAGSGDKSFTMNGCQVKHLLDLIDGEDETEVSLEWFNNTRPDGNSADGEMMPPGLYAWFADYPEEGQMLLPESSAAGSGDGDGVAGD